MKKPRKPEAVEKIKNAILDRALEIIAREGLDNLTMRNLAGRLKMTAPNIYNYYSGKDEIYLCLVVQGFEMLQAVLQEARDSHKGKKEKGRAMIEAYIQFGITHSRYYDIMFVLPTPKYNDYRGTPYEQLSATELRISMEIADMAAQAIRELYDQPAEEDFVTRRLIQVWSLLHGMISLHNSKVAIYVADDLATIYSRTIDELMDLIERL
jgi:AcrR family transcriptional regulator